MEFFTRVLSGNSRIKESSREAEQVNAVFKSNLDGLKNLLQSEESTDVNNLLDMVYESSFPEEQVFMKTPSKSRLRSKKELVVRLLIGLEALGVPGMTDMLVYIKKHGTEGIADTLVTLLVQLSPLLDGKEAPEFTTDDVVDAMDFEWHSSSRKGSPLLNVIASVTSSPRASAASAGDSPFSSFFAASPFRRVLSDRSMFLSRAHDVGSKSVLDKKSSAKPTLTSSFSSKHPSSNQALSSDELTYLQIPPITLPPVQEQPTSNSRNGSPMKGLQKKHRRKSSSLLQLFAEEESEDLMSEGSVGALSKRNSMSSSRRRISSEFAKILLNANEPSSPFFSRGANTGAPEKESLLKAEDEHMEVRSSGKDSSQVLSPPDNVPFWREDAGGPSADLSGDKDYILNPVASTAGLMTLNSDAEAATQHVGHAGMETAPFNTLFTSINDKLSNESTLPVGSGVGSMGLASSEVEDDGGVDVAPYAHTSSNNDDHSKHEQGSSNETVADADDNGERNASDSKYDRSSSTFDIALSLEGTLPLQEDVGNSAAYSNTPTINERTLPLPEDMENLAAFSKAPARDESSLPLQDYVENSAANSIVPTINESIFTLQDNMESSAAYSNAPTIHEPLQVNNMESIAATNDGSTLPLLKSSEDLTAYSTTDESALPMQESNTERSATDSHAPTIGVSRGLENVKNSAVYSNAPILVDRSTLPLEQNMEKSSTPNAQSSTMDESTPPLQDSMEISSASNDVPHTIDGSSLPLQDDMENFAARNNVPTNAELFGNATENASHEHSQVEHKNVLQHGTHQRSRSDSTPARSLFKAESMKEEELNGSQSDRNSSTERLRRRFIERLGSVTSSTESLMMGKGESSDRVVGVVMQELMPWMQMNESANYKKGEDSEGKVSSSESDTDSSTTSTSSSSSAEGLDVDDRQQLHERELETERENDKHNNYEVAKHALLSDSNAEGDKDGKPDLESTCTHEGDVERAPALQADHHLQGESKVDAQQEDKDSHVGFGLFQRILAPLLLPSSIEPAVNEYAPDGLYEKESEEDTESVANEVDESNSSNPREGEATGSKDYSTYDSRRCMDSEIDVKDGIVASSGEANVTAHPHQVAHSQTPAEAANARAVQVNIPLSGTSSDVSVIRDTLPDEEGASIELHIIEHRPPTNVSFAEHDSISASNDEDNISEAKSIEPFRDNPPTDVSHVEHDSSLVSDGDEISEASSSEPFDANHQNDKHIDHEVERHALSPDSTAEGDKEDSRIDLVSTYTHEGDAERAPGLQADPHLQGESKVAAQQEDNNSHVGFGLFQRIVAPLLLPSSIEPALDEYAKSDGLYEKESEEDTESVCNEVDESTPSNSREGEAIGSKDDSTYDPRRFMNNETDVKDGVVASSGEANVTAHPHQAAHSQTPAEAANARAVQVNVTAHPHQAAHSQTPAEAANARAVQVNVPLSGTSSNVSVIQNAPLPDEEGDRIRIHIIEHRPPTEISCAEHDSFSASNDEVNISDAKSTEPFRDNRPIDVSHVEHDSFSVSDGDGISEASSKSEPFHDYRQNDKADLYLNTQVLSNLDGLRTNCELSTPGKVDTLGMHQTLGQELSQPMSNVQENERDLHQTPDHDASTALSSLGGDEKMWSRDEGSQHQGHEDLGLREQGDESNDPPISSSKGVEKVFSGEEGSESQRREAKEMREQGDDYNELDYHSLGADRFLEEVTLATETVVLQENVNIVNLQPSDAVPLTVPLKAQQQPLCGIPVEMEEHLKYNDSQFEQLLSELDTTEEDVPLHAAGAKSDTETGKRDTHGSEKTFKDGAVIEPDLEKLPPEVGHSSLNNETLSQSDVGDLSLGHGTMQFDGGDLGFGKETMEPSVESSRSGKQIMQSDDNRHLGLDIKETLPCDPNVERDYVDNEGQFIVGGPGPIPDLDEGKLQADPQTSYQPYANSEDKNSSPKEGLHGSRVVYEANTDNIGMHAHSPDSQVMASLDEGTGMHTHSPNIQVMASSDEHEIPLEREEVHTKSDGKKEEVKYPQFVEGVLQEEILSKPVCWEASEVVDASSIHPLQVDEGNVQTLSVTPCLAVYAAQLQEGVGADTQKSVSHMFGEASHDAHQPPPTARTLDGYGPTTHGHSTYVSAADPPKSVGHVCERVSHDDHQLPLTARTLDDYGLLHDPTYVAADVHKSVSHISEKVSHDDHQLPFTARTLDDHDPSHGHPIYVSAASYVEPEHVLNQPAATSHDLHMDRWDIESTGAKSKRKRSYAAKLMHGCLSCCREPHINT